MSIRKPLAKRRAVEYNREKEERSVYPYELFWGITLYDILVAIGVAAAFAVFLLYAKKTGVPDRITLLVLICAAVGVALGFPAATLVQSVYFYIEKGVFEWRGMTFYGGLIGGAAFFLAVYFLGGYLMNRKSETPKLHLQYAMHVFGIVICAVTLAHAVGRIGCLTAGCCHGKVFPDRRWYTLPVHHISTNGTLLRTEYAVPVPLFETLFLLALFALLSWRVFVRKEDALPFYMVLYGVWRFCIEYARADDRGATLVGFLSPSQLTAVLLVIGGIVLFVIYYKGIKKPKNAEKT